MTKIRWAKARVGSSPISPTIDAIERCTLIGKIRGSKATSMVAGRHHLILRCRYRTVVKGEIKLGPVIIGDYVNLVDGLLWEQEAVGSSPASPTSKAYSAILTSRLD